jgi:hypothetical protein
MRLSGLQSWSGHRGYRKNPVKYKVYMTDVSAPKHYVMSGKKRIIDIYNRNVSSGQLRPPAAVPP